MDPTFKELISSTIREGLYFIESITCHLPAEVIKEKISITKSFLNLLKILNEKKSLGRTTNNAFKEEKVNNNKVDERKPISIPPDTTTEKYLVIQEDSNSNSHAPRIRLNITVNNKVKGMYYCLIEKGQLLLDRNINAEHSEYVISLSEYTFKAVNNFTIKFNIDELEIILLFGYKIDCTTWMEYLTAARVSVYSYVPVQLQKSDISTPALLIATHPAGLPRKQPPKMQSQAKKPFSGNSKPLPISKSKSTENTRITVDSHLIDMSNLHLEKGRQTFEDRLRINKEEKNHSHAPLGKEENHHVPIKSVKTLPNGKRARLLQVHRVESFDSTDVDDSPFTRSFDSL